jgi:hypothetical protein
MATTVVKVVIVAMASHSKMAMISVAFCKSAAITMVYPAARTFATKLATSTTFIHGVTGTWAAVTAGTTAGRGGTAATTAAHVATTGAGSATTTTTAPAFLRHERYKSTAGRLCGTRGRCGVSRKERCHCQTARQGSRCEKFGTHRTSPFQR